MPKRMKVPKQTGKRKSIRADRLRKANLPGKRKAKSKNAKKKYYWETRRNRTDVKRKSGWI